MHVLLVAYDFPPTPSPQSLRWAYLVRELAREGHRVQVITPDVPGYGRGGLPQLPTEVQVHRVDPGRLSRLLLGRRTGKVEKAASVAGGVPTAASMAVQGTQIAALNWKGRLHKRIERGLGIRDGLNWKGQLAEWIKTWASARMFPDYRVEWVPYAVAKLDELMTHQRPDVVLVSHEPACSLPVGLAAAERGLALAVDMGDPVLAPYTPPRWRKKAFDLERAVCKAARLVSVTTEGAAKLLSERHGMVQDRLLVLPQGYDPGFVPDVNERWLDFDPQRLELLYTGSFYSFRRAEMLLDAVVSLPHARLTVATISAPDYLVEAANKHPESIRLVGFMPHRAALAAQRDCDVLINIANADPVQVPGKVFEYLGAGKPILHLRGKDQDATGALISNLNAGWDIPTEEVAIATQLQQLCDLHRGQKLGEVVVQCNDVQAYAWPSLALKWSTALQVQLDIAHQLQGRGAAQHEAS